MKFTVLTIFPQVIKDYINTSILKQAQEKNLVEIDVLNIRTQEYQQVDDYVYGGGGMILKIDPIISALRSNNLLDTYKILLSPSGKTLKQDICKKLTKHKHIVLICGHYEGIDERIHNYIDEEISIGDYVLTSGSLASLIVLDSVIRLIPGVINPNSLETESFNQYLLDYPSYTRPFDFEGLKVPEIYLSGDHEKIKKFRLKEQIRVTKEKRPDLLKKYLDNKYI